MSRNWKRFLVGLLRLFLELILIRWISIKIRVFPHSNVKQFRAAGMLDGFGFSVPALDWLATSIAMFLQLIL